MLLLYTNEAHVSILTFYILLSLSLCNVGLGLFVSYFNLFFLIFAGRLLGGEVPMTEFRISLKYDKI